MNKILWDALQALQARLEFDCIKSMEYIHWYFYFRSLTLTNVHKAALKFTSVYCAHGWKIKIFAILKIKNRLNYNIYFRLFLSPLVKMIFNCKPNFYYSHLICDLFGCHLQVRHGSTKKIGWPYWAIWCPKGLYRGHMLAIWGHRMSMGDIGCMT